MKEIRCDRCRKKLKNMVDHAAHEIITAAGSRTVDLCLDCYMELSRNIICVIDKFVKGEAR